MPKKPFIVAAGAAGIDLTKFVAAILLGRTIRFGLLIFLGNEFGEHAVDIIKKHKVVFSVVFILILAVLAALWCWKRQSQVVQSDHASPQSQLEVDASDDEMRPIFTFVEAELRTRHT
jgi:uncharacterized membrane protein YdjX (TVP38/TMEM64 family)